MDYCDFIKTYEEEIEEIFLDKLKLTNEVWFVMNHDQQEAHKDFFKQQWEESINKQMEYLLPEVVVYD